MTALDHFHDTRTTPEPQWWPERPQWQRDAACRGHDPSLWYPAEHENATQAKAICRSCPVQPECLAWALTHREHGVWGGLSERERRALRGGRGRPA